MEGVQPRFIRPGPTSGGSDLDIDWLSKIYKGRGTIPGFLSRCAAHPSCSFRPPKRQARRRCSLSFFTTLPIIMFSKTFLASLVLGALCVNALTVPVAREPAPGRECEFPRSFYHMSSRTDLGLLRQSKLSTPGTSLRRENSMPESSDLSDPVEAGARRGRRGRKGRKGRKARKQYKKAQANSPNAKFLTTYSSEISRPEPSDPVGAGARRGRKGREERGGRKARKRYQKAKANPSDARFLTTCSSEI